MYAIYGDIYHQYIPHVSLFLPIHGSVMGQDPFTTSPPSEFSLGFAQFTARPSGSLQHFPAVLAQFHDAVAPVLVEKHADFHGDFPGEHRGDFPREVIQRDKQLTLMLNVSEKYIMLRYLEIVEAQLYRYAEINKHADEKGVMIFDTHPFCWSFSVDVIFQMVSHTRDVCWFLLPQ